MRALPVVLVIAAAGLCSAVLPAQAQYARYGNPYYDRPQERWCTVRNPGLGNIIWDCRYRSLQACANVMGPTSDFCLENPNWPPRRYLSRW